jgi:hypothetical protein
MEILVMEERGKVEEVHRDESRLLLGLISRNGEAERTHCLQYIDPYGDTVFNQQQVRRLVQELEELRSTTRVEKEAALVDRLRAMAEQVLEEPHRYLKFVGD